MDTTLNNPITSDKTVKTEAEITPQNIAEKIVYRSITLIWVFYFTGLLYVAGSAVGWLLLTVLFLQFLKGEELKNHWLVYIWTSAMLVMLLTIFIGHINLNLSTGSLIKSTIGWAKGWALFAVFPFVAALNIRPQLVVRAMMKLGQQTLFIIPLLVIAAFIHLPGNLYSSPLKFLANPSFFDIELYGLNASTGLPRWRLFTPWGPALGLYGNLLLALCFTENNTRFRVIGFVTAFAMILLSQSRMGMLCMLCIPFFCFNLIRVKQIKYLIILAILAPVLAAFAKPALIIAEDLTEQIHNARSDSSRVRGALERIAIERWKNEAPIWGHGVVEKGSHYVEYMPIGSHHTWLGLLFVKGLIGLLAMAIPLAITLAWTGFRYFVDSDVSESFVRYRTALHLLLILCAYSLTENLEILAYLHWPALLFIGLTLKMSCQRKP